MRTSIQLTLIAALVCNLVASTAASARVTRRPPPGPDCSKYPPLSSTDPKFAAINFYDVDQRFQSAHAPKLSELDGKWMAIGSVMLDSGGSYSESGFTLSDGSSAGLTFSVQKGVDDKESGTVVSHSYFFTNYFDSEGPRPDNPNQNGVETLDQGPNAVSTGHDWVSFDMMLWTSKAYYHQASTNSGIGWHVNEFVHSSHYSYSCRIALDHTLYCQVVEHLDPAEGILDDEQSCWNGKVIGYEVLRPMGK